METDVQGISEKVRLTKELLDVKKELEKLKKHQKEYKTWLEEMSFIISHKVRSSIAHIQGISGLLNRVKLSASSKILVQFIKRAAQSLSVFTVELSAYIDKKTRILKDRFL